MFPVQPSGFSMLLFSAGIGWILTGLNLGIGFSRIRLLTLKSTWIWAVLAWLALSALLIVELVPGWRTAAIRSTAGFFCATMLLAPLTDSLGARRPGHRAWPWFVVLPMIVVLQWPVAWQIWQSRGQEAVEIGYPAMIGFATVLLMGFGNYFGTGNTLAAVLVLVSAVLLMLPVSGWVAADSRLPTVVPILLAAASSLILRRQSALERIVVRSPHEAANRVWLMFRDSFGILWAKRVMDRMNQFSQRERWEILLTLDGFVPGQQIKERPQATAEGGHAADLAAQDLERPLQILCWIMKRFAEPEWLRKQLGPYFPESTADESRGTDV